jgi:AcrR family transcriptional regulator
MVRPVRHREIAREATSRKGARNATAGKADRDAKRDARRAALVEAAVEVIRRDGPGVSMDQMAAEAGVTKPILYRHFDDRAGLVKAIAEHAYNQVATGLDQALHADVSPRQLVASTIDVYLRFIESDPALYRFLVNRTIAETTDPGAILTDYISRAGRQVALVLGEGLRAAGLDSGPAEPWAFGIVGMVHSAGDWWLERGTMPRSRLTEYLTSLIYDGIPNVDQLGPARTWLRTGPSTDTSGRSATTDRPTKAGASSAEEDEPPTGDITPLPTTRRRSS